jgi:hypothetical protein
MPITVIFDMCFKATKKSDPSIKMKADVDNKTDTDPKVISNMILTSDVETYDRKKKILKAESFGLISVYEKECIVLLKKDNTRTIQEYIACYRLWSLIYHPDKASPDNKELYNRLMQKLNNAADRFKEFFESHNKKSLHPSPRWVSLCPDSKIVTELSDTFPDYPIKNDELCSYCSCCSTILGKSINKKWYKIRLFTNIMVV